MDDEAVRGDRSNFQSVSIPTSTPNIRDRRIRMVNLFHEKETIEKRQ